MEDVIVSTPHICKKQNKTKHNRPEADRWAGKGVVHDMTDVANEHLREM